jgi:hypothetical protein
LQTIKDSINEGELKTNNLIKNIQWKEIAYNNFII